MKNKTILILEFIFVILFLIITISAAGVSSFYTKDNPLEMYLRETKTIEFNLQNMVGNEDITFKVELIQGSDIASLEKDTYFVKAGTHDTMVPLKVTIPEDFGKTSQRIELNFKTIASGETGGILMGTAYGVSFDVIISEKPKETPKIKNSTGIIIPTIFIILIIIIIYLILKRKNK